MFDPQFLGRNNFVWFFGVVEDRQDPLKLGRVRVRCIGWHSDDKTEIPTEMLPWANVPQPITSASVSGVGSSPSGLVEGTHVMGFFADGEDAQEPFVLFSYPGIPLSKADTTKGFNDPRTNTNKAPKTISKATYTSDGTPPTIVSSDSGNFPRNIDEPDTSRLSRNETAYQSAVIKLRTDSRAAGQAGIPTAQGGTAWSEPTNAYASVYPYNHVEETESGHVIEKDDTPGAERLNLFHRTGSFTEFQPDGSVINKAVNNKYDITHVNSYEHVSGQKLVTVEDGMRLLVQNRSGSGLIIEAANGDISIKSTAGKVLINGNLEVTGYVKATGEVTALSAVPAVAVHLSTHTHPETGTTTGAPTPGS